MDMTVGYYKGSREAEDAMAVLARWISRNSKIKVQYHNGTAIDADPDTGVIRIPRMACASGITEEALMLLRGRVYHEAGHIDESTAVKRPEYPKEKSMFEIWNALEDRRMEAAESAKHEGCRYVFNWNVDYYNKDIAGKISSGSVNAPLWEALCAMAMLSESRQPLWKLTPKAQAYADAAYDEFVKVHSCKDSRDTLNLAKVIHQILKEKNQELKEETPKQDGGKSKENQKGQKSEKNQEPQSGGASDMEEESGEDSEESDEGEEKESKESKSNKDEEKESNKSDKDSKGEDSEDSNKGKDGDLEKESSSGEGEEGEEDSEEEGKGGKGEEDSEESDDSDGDDEGDEESESDYDGDDSDKESDDDSASPVAAEGSEEGEDGDKGEEGDDSDSSESDGDVKTGNSKYEPEDKVAMDGEDIGDDKRNLDEECDGVTQEQVVNEGLEKLFGDMNVEDLEYTSRRDLDQHRSPAMTDDNKQTFINERQSISVQVATMTRALEQALRGLSRCKKQPYLRHGKIDKKRLVSIAKGLSKEVFYRKQDGIDLDVAVEITIDESGSMSNYRDVRLLAVAIGEALEAIGIPFEITGSTTAYSADDRSMPDMDGFSRVNPIIYNHYKTFEEKWQQVRPRMVHTGLWNHNIDGEVVEYAAFRLAGRKERRKIIFSLSDGLPCGGHDNDYDMAKNLKRVCDRVRKAGIEVLGFGIGTMGPEPLYGKNFFILLEKANSMGPEFVKQFAKIVTGGMVKV